MSRVSPVTQRDWILRKVGDLFTVDGQLIGPENSAFGQLPFLGLENIESDSRQFINGENKDTGKSTCFRFGPQHVLYGKLRPYLNKVFLPTHEGRCSLEILPLLPKNGFNRDFVAAVLQSPQVVMCATRHSTGGRMPRADTKKLLAVEILSPRVIDECNLVGANLSERLRTSLDLARAAKNQLGALAVFEYSLLRQTFETPATSGWRKVRIGKLAEIVMGQSPDGATYNKAGWGVPLLNGPTEFGEDHPTPLQWTTSPRKVCKPHDLLLCVRGNTTGRMNQADQIYALGRGVAALRGRENEGHTRFVRHVIRYQLGKLLVGSGRSTFPNIGKDDIASFECYAPTTVSEQVRFSIELDSKLEFLHSSADAAFRQAEAAFAVPAAILREAFKFESRVNT